VSVLNETVTRLSGQRSRHTKTVDIQRKGAARSIESITELNAIARFVMHAFSCMRPHRFIRGPGAARDRSLRPTSNAVEVSVIARVLRRGTLFGGSGRAAGLVLPSSHGKDGSNCLKQLKSEEKHAFCFRAQAARGCDVR
jgi:hypothetical protein